MTLKNLATIVMTIMSKLESKTTVSPPTHSGDNHDQIPRSPPKTTCKNQAQSKPARIGVSSVLPIDAVDVSYVRMTRSKDVKFKSVSGAAGDSEVEMKGCQSKKVLKKQKATRGGGSRGCGTKGGNRQPVSARGGTQEGGSAMEGMWKLEVAPRTIQRVRVGWKALLGAGVWKTGIRGEGSRESYVKGTMGRLRVRGGGECTWREKADS